MRLRAKVQGADMEIKVETLTGKIIRIACTPADTVAFVKDKIEDSEKVSPDQQRLVFHGRKLKDRRTLSSYAIQNENTIYVVLNLSGGWTRRVFADVSNQSNLITEDFDNTAPAWTLVKRGLNIIGICKNPECDVFSEVVTHPFQYNSFNLFRDNTVMCPICHSAVKPITCGFHDCVWRFEGIRSQDGFLITSSWKDANGEMYHRFHVDKHGCVKWDSLLIVVKERSEAMAANLVGSPNSASAKENDVCATCWSPFGSTEDRSITTAPCGHNFHRGCIKKWSKWCSSHSTLSSCPVCLRSV